MYGYISCLNAINEVKESGFGSLQVFREAYPLLCNDGKYLYHFGSLLALNHTDSLASVRVLERARGHFVNAQVVETLAATYFEIGDKSKATENLLWLNNFVPSKFRYKLQLLKIYASQANRLMIAKLAGEILSMPVKKRSREVDLIKQEVRTMLIDEKISLVR